jgi:hypothetical protein
VRHLEAAAEEWPRDSADGTQSRMLFADDMSLGGGVLPRWSGWVAASTLCMPRPMERCVHQWKDVCRSMCVLLKPQRDGWRIQVR